MSGLRPLSQWLLKQKTTHVKEEIEELLKQMYEMIKGTSLVWFETFPLWWSHVGFHSLRRDENPPWLRLLSVFAWICYTCKYKVYTFKTAFVGISTQTLYIRNWHFEILWVSPDSQPFSLLSSITHVLIWGNWHRNNSLSYLKQPVSFQLLS